MNAKQSAEESPSSLKSCIYRGRVRHRRFTPDHGFQYSTSWLYLDLAEVDGILNKSFLLGRRRFSIASYRRQDHFGDASVSMEEAVHGRVLEETGLRVSGPIRLLTQLRHFGVYFSPINVFYCFDESETLQAVVGEVSNTPWNQRHVYVLWDGNRVAQSKSRFSHPKAFHVSPFMDMDSFYDWRVRAPADRLHLSIGSRQGSESHSAKRIFHADLSLNRYPISESQILITLMRRPIAAVQIIGAIYYQAFRLWMKKCRYFPHPSSRPENLESQKATNLKTAGS